MGYEAHRLNVASLLENSARDFPEKVAVIYGDMRLTYHQINAMASQVANGLKSKGIGKGDKVALSMLNLPYFPIIYYGILKTGATVVPLNVLFKRNEISYHLKDSDAKAYFAFIGTEQLPMGQEALAGFSEVDSCEHFWIILPPGVDNPFDGVQTLDDLMNGQSPNFWSVSVDKNDPAVILYTSGTTGQPKGAVLSHSNIYFNAFVVQGLFRQTSDDIHLVVLPLFHSFGQVVQMNAGFLSGCTLVLIPRFEPAAVLSALEKENVTVFAGVPTMYWALLNFPNADEYDLQKISRTLRLGASGGSAMPVEIMKGFEEKYNVTILEGYGLSETSPVASFSRMDLPKKPGSIGVPIQGVEMAIMDENGNMLGPNEIGEIVIRGHNIMLGYYNKPEATEEAFRNGWFHSGDLGKIDEDGYYYVVDRLKDMIIRGGFNVYPREVEEVMLTHPKISLVAVVGEKDEEYGEEVVAYVVLKEGETATPEEIIEWCKNQMASYKYPRRVYIKESLPMTATGKILKRVLTNG
ncbi:MAG: long-chain fatty acid--CoA ligase [Methanobacteriota archaeon]|nr:MAG: long-chain fatty acid--CoA ligase [Euryarchaeota archaeon]